MEQGTSKFIISDRRPGQGRDEHTGFINSKELVWQETEWKTMLMESRLYPQQKAAGDGLAAMVKSMEYALGIRHDRWESRAEAAPTVQANGCEVG